MIPFHRVLIATAIVFCAMMAAWAGWRGTVALAAAFAVATLALAYYLRHLTRFLGRGR